MIYYYSIRAIRTVFVYLPGLLAVFIRLEFVLDSCRRSQADARDASDARLAGKVGQSVGVEGARNDGVVATDFDYNQGGGLSRTPLPGERGCRHRREKKSGGNRRGEEKEGKLLEWGLVQAPQQPMWMRRGKQAGRLQTGKTQRGNG